MMVIFDPNIQEALTVQVENEIKEFVARMGGNVELIESIASYDDDTHEANVSHHKTTLEQVAREVREYKHYQWLSKKLPDVKTVEELEALYYDVVDEGGATLISLRTKEGFEKDKKEREFQEHEEVAKRFAAECGKGIGTFDFIRALEKEIRRVRGSRDDWNSHERRHEEYAAHRFAGGGTETYFDDLNFENSRYSSRIQALEGVFDYLRDECPLLMARYEEMKLKGEWKEEEEEEEEE